MNINYQTLILKKVTLEELKNVKYNDNEGLTYNIQLTYDEIIDMLDLKSIPIKRMGYSLSPVLYEMGDLNNTLKYILPDNVKVSVTNDDFRLESNLKINQTRIFTERTFFYTILGFTRSFSCPLDDMDGFHQSDRRINITGIDKFHLKCDCMQGSIVNRIREPILFSFALSSPPSHQI